MDQKDELNSLFLSGAPEDTRIVVAMSGGVDSSVVAALLKDEGYDVVGITLQLYDHGSTIENVKSCCAGRDIEDARKVAETVGIPHYVLNYESRFSESVIDNFVDSYLAGETPVPCIDCNQKIKFRDLLQASKELGAQALATGHYIASRPGAQHWEMHRAKDAERDQSYFLFNTPREDLSFLRFPLGGYDKAETRRLAQKYDLDIAHKPDSQDICFVPTGHYTNLINKLRPESVKPGVIRTMAGEEIGRHDGIVNYTIGQRRGLGIATGEPVYVISIDSEKNEIIVGQREDLAVTKLRLRDINWLGDGTLEDFSKKNGGLFVKIRSSQTPVAAQISYENEAFFISFQKQEYGVSPGQACVFYSDDLFDARVLGGGWICREVHVTSERIIES